MQAQPIFHHLCTTTTIHLTLNDVPTLFTRSSASKSPSKSLTTHQNPRFLFTTARHQRGELDSLTALCTQRIASLVAIELAGGPVSGTIEGQEANRDPNRNPNPNPSPSPNPNPVSGTIEGQEAACSHTIVNIQ